jgi:vacuole morphology and inheritance protein 14
MYVNLAVAPQTVNGRGVLRVQAYEHVCEIVGSYGQLPMSVETLVQLDRLVQMLETPTFTLLRLHLLRPALHPCLLKCATPP